MSDYDAYHRSLISYVPKLSPSIKERFLPFWAVCSVAEVAINSARIGYDEWTYSLRERRWVRYTSWKTVHWGRYDRPSWTKTYDANEHIDMQIYGSYEYRRAYVNGVRCVGCFAGATRLTPEIVEYEDGVRGLEEFKMDARAALKIAGTVIQGEARAQAQELLVKMFPGANSTSSIEVDVQLTNLLVAPIYVPVFIFESNYFGEVVRTFVHGARILAVGGQRLYQAPLAAMAGGFAGAALVLLDPWIPVKSYAVLGASVAGVCALLYPILALRFREWWRVRESGQQVWREWGQDYVNAYEMWESYARRRDEARSHRTTHRSSQEYGEDPRGFYGYGDPQSFFYGFYHQQQQQQQQRQRAYYQQQQERQEQQQERARYGDGDPKGYYARLGLEPGASESEIKAAFRSLALKHHPDRFQDPKDKAKAKGNFIKISEAYQVLRDADKRRQYSQQW